MLDKVSADNLACFGGKALFDSVKSTSSLYQPQLEAFLAYSKQFHDRKWYTNNGVLVKELERRLAEFHNVPYCITFCSGFWALALTMAALKLDGRSEVLMPSFTYRRMADIAAWVGLKPRFCEVDPETLAITAETARPWITDQTALILGMHPIVNCCDVNGLVELGREHGIPVLFDGVESMYESIPEGKIGQFGEAECFSLHASKLLNGFEGGYVTTTRRELAEKLGLLRGFGFQGQDRCVLSGALNAKLNEVHAAMALANLDELPQVIHDNELRYRAYQRGLSGAAAIPGLRLLAFDESQKSSFKNIVVDVQEAFPLTRDELVTVLNAERILARAHYAPALHQKVMQYPYVPAHLPVTDKLAERFLNLPCGYFVEEEDIERVCEFLRFVHQHGPVIRNRLKLKEAA